MSIELTRGQKGKETKILNIMKQGFNRQEAEKQYTEQLKEMARKGGKVKSDTKGFAHPTATPGKYGKMNSGRIRRSSKV